ncbi:hypothetical protein D7322_27205 [Sphingobacterium puteale]|uniref:Uncharacterized protein n=1 Tax=Sphingobacterium puteale TaxID=2420510 RepID=A0A420VQ37_9SPHI|nr:hypothetical protein [Sphingobacterium puteale]RKO68444.1 hypothetical protein D7322_27205 [Sphingobacterium puteale]
MINVDQSELFHYLKESIQNQLEWGETSTWSTVDFEKLSGKVQERTGVMLSISTLKRIFGRVDYQSAPSLTTLNTLSQFIGYEDWRAFRNTYSQKRPTKMDVPMEAVSESFETARKKTGHLFFKIIFPVLGLVLMGFLTQKFVLSRHSFPTSAFHFSSKTILTQGLPNSVVFDYSASEANTKDTIFIAQSWDTRRKVAVDKNGKHHSSIYYYPGYFRAKLMVGNKVVREHDIQIKTDGWLGLIEADWGKEPLYFRKADIIKPNEIAVGKELLEKYKIDLLADAPPVRLYNQKDITGVMTNNFSFETELKTRTANGVNSCQRVEVLLQSKNDIIIVPLVNPACIGDIALIADGFYTDSKQDDLSGFGCDLSKWTKLKIDCKNQQIRFWINDKQAYMAMIKNAPTEIVGVQYRFKGPGFVRNTRLWGSGNKEIVF